MIGIGVGLITLIGAAGTLFADDGRSKVDRYRTRLADGLCGDLKAAVQTSQPQLYAGERGLISKPAWLAAMDTTAGHLSEGQDTLQTLPPPADLHNQWQTTSDAWADYLTFWSDYRQATTRLSDDELTVFKYPPPQWTQRLNAANGSFGASIENLMKTSCSSL